MTKIAFVFPGQGSQSVGMGADLLAKAESQAFYTKADEAIGKPLSTLMLEGPQEELTLTYYAQPALLTTGVMVAERLKSEGIVPDYVAGHSLGEYSALVVADAISFEDGVNAVHERGLLMDEAVPAGVGAMAAILSLDKEPLAEVCERVTASGESVQLANINCPGQIVISGTKAGVEQACILAKEAGAKRAIPLVVSGPFHSRLMEPAAEKFKVSLANVELSNPIIPVVSNVTSELIETAEAIPAELIAQLSSPVLWEQNVRKLIELGVTTFVECGPGKVLAGLIKKIDRNVQVHCVYDEATLQEVVRLVKGEGVVELN